MAKPAEPGRWRAREWLPLWPLLLALAVAAAWVWHNAAVRREAENRKRGEMYRRTLENVQSVCLVPRAGLEGYCRDQATLLLEYPECDPACIALVHRVRGEPAR